MAAAAGIGGAHPRSRGENAIHLMPHPTVPGSSPLTRGKLSVVLGASQAGGLIPAHAGKTDARNQDTGGRTAHPRSRGENVREARLPRGGRGSSPLTRGKLVRGSGPIRAYGLIPAHAGKTLEGVLDAARHRAHPRSRGENPSKASKARGTRGSSPLTRGKHGKRSDVGPRRGLIPAHAGKTAVRRMLRRSRWAHPRSRGENAEGRGDIAHATGSSPLTRGKRIFPHQG